MFEVYSCIILLIQLMEIVQSLELTRKPVDFSSHSSNFYKRKNKKYERISSLNTSVLLDRSQSTFIKKNSQTTFQTQTPYLDSNKNVILQLQIKPTDQSLTTWNHNQIYQATPPLKKQVTESNQHKKSLSFNRRPSIHSNYVKTQSFADQQYASYLSKREKLESIKNIRIYKFYQPTTPQNITINQQMINKFKPCRQYQNSKIIRYNILPSFLKFSISKRCEKNMNKTLKSNAFRNHKVYFENKFIYL